MVFLTKLGFENLKNLVTPSPFCKVRRVTELLDGRVTSSPWKTTNFQGLDDDFDLKRPNHHLGPEYMHLFRAKKVWYMGRLFWEISSFMQKNLTKLHDLTVLKQFCKFWIFCRIWSPKGLNNSHRLPATHYLYKLYCTLTQRRGMGWGRVVPERRLEGQQFQSWVENTNMTDCISTL